MTDESKTPRGRIRVSWHIDFFDADEFAEAVEKIADATAQVKATPNGGARASLVTTGRYCLTDAEWEERFEVVRRITNLKDERKLTFERACELEGIPYSTFRYWRGKMREKRGAK
jgi:hypothetical protein